MTKHQQYFHDMLENHKDIFDNFKKLHDEYEKDAKKWQVEFNKEGQRVLTIIRKYENLLCSHSESSHYGKFSSNLADKFWESVRKYLPKIDFVGLQK